MSNFLVQGGAPPDDSVTTVKVKDDAINLAKMAGLARGKLIYGDASGDPAALAVGAANEVLTHDGTDFDWAAAAGGGLQSVQVFTSSGTWTKPAGINSVKVTVTGGGGGGGHGASGTDRPGGGGAGGTAIEFIDVTGTSSETITIGAAGAAGSDSDGSAGGTSSFGSFCSASGGAGGPMHSGNSGDERALGGVGSGGDINIGGSTGRGQYSAEGAPGGGSYWGAGGSGGTYTHQDGLDADAYGAGGGANLADNETSGAGFVGIIFVEEYG